MSNIRFARTEQLLRIAVLQFVVLAVAACTNPAGMRPVGSDTGVLALSAGMSSFGAQTVFPQVEQELIDSYLIVLEGGPANRIESTVLASDNGGFPEDVTIEDVVPGTWDSVTITAYDGEDPTDENSLAVLRGSADTVTVNAGEFTDVNIFLEFIDDEGTGEIEFEISWPEDSGVYNLAYSVVPFDGGSTAPDWTDVGEQQFSAPDDGRNSYTIEDELDVGVYLSTVRLDIAGDEDDEDSRDNSVWIMDEIVYVSENLTTFTEIAVDDKTLSEVFVDSFSQEIEGDDDWQESDDDEDGDFLYSGTGGTTLEFDAFGQDVTLYFRVRNENNTNGGGPFDDNQVEVVDSDNGDQLGVDEVPYPYGQSTREENEDFLGRPYLGAREGDENDPKGDDYPEVLDDTGFLQFEVDIDEGTSFQIQFQGGTFREYSIGFFEVEER